MIKWESVKAGDVLYDNHREKAGNLNASRWGVWEVRIIDIDHAAGKATVSWNGNRAETWYRQRVEKLRRKKPVLKKEWWER